MWKTIVVIVAVASGCEFREETPNNNGDEGQLSLVRTVARWNSDSDTGDCGMPPSAPDPTCSCRAGTAGIGAALGTTLDWSIINSVRVRFGNGLGDTSEYGDYLPLDAGDLAISIVPPTAATVHDAFECDGGVRLYLEATGEQDFELSVTVDGFSDRWFIPVGDTCDEIAGCDD